MCKKIRQHYEESHSAAWRRLFFTFFISQILPIMMLSANTKAGSKPLEYLTPLPFLFRSYEHGSTDFMTKPFQKEALRQRVQEVMQKDRSSSSSNISAEMRRQTTAARPKRPRAEHMHILLSNTISDT